MGICSRTIFFLRKLDVGMKSINDKSFKELADSQERPLLTSTSSFCKDSVEKVYLSSPEPISLSSQIILTGTATMESIPELSDSTTFRWCEGPSRTECPEYSTSTESSSVDHLLPYYSCRSKRQSESDLSIDSTCNFSENFRLLACCKRRKESKDSVMELLDDDKSDTIRLLSDWQDIEEVAFDLTDVSIRGLDNDKVNSGVIAEIPLWILETDDIWDSSSSADSTTNSSTRKGSLKVNPTGRYLLESYKSTDAAQSEKSIVMSKSSRSSRSIQSMSSSTVRTNIASRLGTLLASTLSTVSEGRTSEEEDTAEITLPRSKRQYLSLPGLSMPTSEDGDDEVGFSPYNVTKQNSIAMFDNDCRKPVEAAEIRKTVDSGTKTKIDSVRSESDNSTITSIVSRHSNCPSADGTSISSISWSVATNEKFLWKEDNANDLVDSSDHEVE